MREEFEKLTKIANRITESTAIYNEKFNWYECYNDNMGYNHEKFINGAWYAFQERQKKIDELIKSNIAVSEQLDRFKKELLK